SLAWVSQGKTSSRKSSSPVALA
ncbi:hypothetical protein AB1N83_009819, partial [Pleurotus pulmonarius]